MKIKHLLSSIGLVLIITNMILACGAPQAIHGQAYQTWTWGPGMHGGISNATVELRILDEPITVQTVRTNPFGYYRFDEVLSCGSYEVQISHKWYLFQPATAVIYSNDFPGTPDGLTLDFVAPS